MPPVPSASPPDVPRIITYYQTTHTRDDRPISILPLVTQPGVSVTNVIVAAIHLNEDPEAITLNDHHPDHARYHTMWAEMRVLQASGVKVLGMLGGHARGSFARLDVDGGQPGFEAHYAALHRLVTKRALDGLDLDVEEPMSLRGIVHLIDRLRADFGPRFLITLAPVAAALLGDDDPRRNLSGFGYDALHAARGHEIAWYNAQFYCGWGDCSNPAMYDMILARRRIPADKLVVGLVTNPANGSGWVPWEVVATVLPVLAARRPGFGGVMGWEYFNSLPGGEERPWEWAMFMTALLRSDASQQPQQQKQHKVPDALESSSRQSRPSTEAVESTLDDADASVPHDFEYFSEEAETSDSP